MVCVSVGNFGWLDGTTFVTGVIELQRVISPSNFL